MSGGITAGIGAAVAAVGTSKGLSGLNEGRKMASSYLQNYRPTDFTSSGLSGKFANNTFSLTRTSEGQASLDALKSAYSAAGSDFRSLAAKVTPGMSELTNSRLDQVETSRRRSVGNLRENLQRRRVLGSSFGQDAIARAEREFSQEADRVKAESFLQELDMQTQLLAKANAVAIEGSNAVISQLNFESGMAAQMSSQISGIFAQNTQLNAQLTAEMFAARAGLLANVQQSGLNMVESGFGQMAAGG